MLSPAFDYHHLMAVQKTKVMHRLLRRLRDYNGGAVLDLEDAFWDVYDPESTRLARDEARGYLWELAASKPELFAHQRIAIRINHCDSPDFQKDVQLLQDLRPKIQFSRIFISKISQAAHIALAAQQLGHCVASPDQLIPMLESQQAIDTLPELLQAAKQAGMQFVSYGHYDYSYDAGHFPFLDVDDAGFWGIVEPFIQAVENVGLNFIAPPIFHLNNIVLQTWYLARLANTCTRGFHIWSLSMAQTTVCEAFLQGQRPSLPHTPPPKAPALTPEQLQAYAQEICTAYNRYRHEKKSFALDTEHGEFISPHKYLAARRYLEQQHGKTHG